jgi:hypothetical protein
MTIVACRAFYAVDFLTEDFRQRFYTGSAHNGQPRFEEAVVRPDEWIAVS